MIIILEGPDGAGKTTLAGNLAKHFAANGEEILYLHSRHHKNQWKYDCALVRRAIVAHVNGKHVIMDRSWIGDNIYGRIYRDGGGTWVRQHDALLRRYGAVYAFCLPSRETVIAEHKKKHAAGLEKFATVDKIYDAYHDLWHGNSLKWAAEGMNYVEQLATYGGWKHRDDGVLFDWQKQSVSWLVRELRGCELKNSLSDAIHTDALNFRGGIRRWHNMYLFVMSDHPEHGVEACALPFPMFGRDWFKFTKAMHMTGLPETHLCYTDFHDPNDNFRRVSSTPKCVHTLMSDCRVVAVGSYALKHCIDQKIPVYRKIPYPVLHDEAAVRKYSYVLREVLGG